MTLAPLSPEAVAQMVADLRTPFGPADENGDYHVMGWVIDLCGKASDMLTTLSAENATLLEQRDFARFDATNGWAAEQASVKRNAYHYDRAKAALAELATLRASEAAAVERVKVLEDAVTLTVKDASHHLRKYREHCLAALTAALTPTADKE